MARAVRVLLWTLLVLAVLLVVLWFFRRELLAPMLRSQLEAVLAAELGAQRVSIGAIDGDWLRTLDVRDLDVEGAAPPLRELRGARLQARVSLPALLGGDLAGLRQATVEAAFVEVDVRPGAASEPAGAGEAAFDFAAYEPLLRLFPDGARVRIERLRVLLPDGERQAPFDCALRPGSGARDLELHYADVDVQAGVPAAPTSGGTARARLDLVDPGALLDQFGLRSGVREGKLHAAVQASIAPLRLEAQIDLSDLVHEHRRLDRSHIVASYHDAHLYVDSATIDLPGLSVELRELNLPDPVAAGSLSLHEVAGRFAVRIDDLSAHVDLLPEPVRALMPIRGRLAGTFASGALQLEASEVTSRGMRLVLERGTFPLAAPDWRAAQGSLSFRLALTDFGVPLSAAAGTTLSGAVAGTVTGSLDQPQLEARLDLGECRTDLGSCSRMVGRLRASPAALSVEGLHVEDVRIAALGPGGATRLDLDAGCRLRDGTIDPDSLVAKIAIESPEPCAMLAKVFAAEGLGSAPQGNVALQLEARHDANGITIGALRVHTAPESPVGLSIDGQGTLPVHWAGASQLAVLESGALALHVEARRPASRADDLPLAFDGTLRIEAGSVALAPFELTVGPGRARGQFLAAGGVAAAIGSPTDLADTPLQVSIDLDEFDLTRLPTSWLAPLALAGRVTGHVRAGGTTRQFTPDVELTLADGELRGDGVPTVTGADCRLTARANDSAPGELLCEARISARLETQATPGTGLDSAVELTARVRCDDTGTTLEPTVLSIGGGEVAIALRSNLRRSDLLAGSFTADEITLAGTIGLREYSLDRMPIAMLGLGSLRGLLSGEVALDGTLGAFGPSALQSARLSLRDGEVKAANLPRLEHLAAELVADQHVLTLRSLTGSLGAGRFSAEGTLSPTEGTLADSFENARLQLQVHGEDLLLYRGEGAKVRASIAVTASGTPARMAVGGQVVLGRGSRYVRRISVVPDFGAQGGAAPSEGLRLAELPPNIGDRLEFDVAIGTSEPFEVRTSVFDTEIDVAARLRGTGSSPRIEGTMAMRRGVLRFPGANLHILSGLLTFTRAEPLFPEVVLQAEGKRIGFQVSMTITGRYDQPQIQLSSVPPLPQQDLIVLLTTGQLPSTLSQRGAEGQARFVGGYLAKEVFDAYFGSDSTERGESMFDRLTFETGREVSKNGTESMLVEYELAPHLSAQVERDAYEDYNMGLVLRFRFK
ncbi:MAG TPA: translocation/assembly module TamB domain-containing protein [Planctomycetota bacterium]|nr:translocation/assembly module TamB domain-containing protein [Planctomycetota bacterium]